MANRGFFAGSTLRQSRPPEPTIPLCGACGLLKTCKSPKMAVAGGGARKILIVGEAPGKNEDEQNIPFVGEAGSLLRRTLGAYGIHLDHDCWRTNALICRPPGNITPTDKQIGYCRPNLTRAINELNPTVIVPLGGPAVAAVLGTIWRGSIGPMGRWAGWRIPLQRLNAWVCPTWHPAFILRGEEGRKPGEDVAKTLWRRHLRTMAGLTGRPWAAVPDYRREIELIHDPTDAARIIRGMVARGGPCAWDIETNALKPEGPNARIVSSSICWRGRRTIAYPWHGEAIRATDAFTRSPCPKIVGNLKFEDRWARAKLGHPVRGWWHDTVLGGHHHDNRRGITSVGFQAFVWLGAEPYDDHISPYLETDEDEEINEIIRQIDLKDLLIYNGKDALLEYRIAEVQRRELGLPWAK